MSNSRQGRGRACGTKLHKQLWEEPWGVIGLCSAEVWLFWWSLRLWVLVGSKGRIRIKRTQIYHLRDRGARDLHFNNLPYPGFAQSPPPWAPWSRVLTGTYFSSAPQPLWCPGAWGVESWQNSFYMETEKWNRKSQPHSPRKWGFFSTGESLRVTEAEERGEACLVKATGIS